MNIRLRKASGLRYAALCAIAWVAFFIPVAKAQFDAATPTGVISDPSPAVISGAAVKAINEASNIEDFTTTNESGR